MAANKKSSILKWLVIVVAVVGAGVGGVAYFRKPNGGPVDFKTVVVARGEITQAVTANGALNPVRTVTVGSQISGIITELKVDFNSRVREGDELAKIDPATYERALARAVADLANAQAGLELAKYNAKRAKQLFADKLISESDFEQADVALQQADANVKIHQASVDSAKVDLDRTTIVAPISGMVISRKVDAGQTVAASFNTPELFTIANDLTKMQIETLVSEADIGGVQEGQNVRFTVDAFPGRKFSGRVNQVRFAPITNQNVVTYTTVVEVDNKDLKLRPGMTANATIITAQRTNVLYVPDAALRFHVPDNAVIGSTNDAVARAAGGTAPASKSEKKAEIATSGPFAGLPIPPWQAGGERRRPTEQERSEYEASLTPEQKEKYQRIMAEFRARFAQRAQGEGGGGPGTSGGGGGMFGGGNRNSSQNEGPAIRKVYVLDKERSTPGRPVLTVVTVKTGISDGTNTEVQEGLKEGDVVITGTSTVATTAAPAVNPFRGPFGGGRR
ncbi:MAG TPA: efflux RND transporter periplasmic adaptor subunit [Candidatus Angelobacter sp.]|nr:efflux RND transporter periplasmic adaptor subunit [Candidatus Angelobacter sp.]